MPDRWYERLVAGISDATKAAFDTCSGGNCHAGCCHHALTLRVLPDAEMGGLVRSGYTWLIWPTDGVGFGPRGSSACLRHYPNPIIPVHLTKEIWQPIDGFAAILFLAGIIFVRGPALNQTSSNQG